MELILQTGLRHQEAAVEAVAGVFEGVAIAPPTRHNCNPEINLGDPAIGRNIRAIQQLNGITAPRAAGSKPGHSLNLDVKMETGTGKTYVYTHTIYELNKRYGINKFVIAVPTLPIKAGTAQFMADPYVQRHFKNTRGYGAELDLCVLNAAKTKRGRLFFPTAVRVFAGGAAMGGNRIYVLLVNLSLLTTGRQLSRSDYGSGVDGFFRPFDAIRSTRPFVIIDEPHKFARNQKGYNVIMDELRPQCVIRFGATFPTITAGRGKNKTTTRDYDHLLYDLNACQAFNRGLIKGVAKEHFQPENQKEEKIQITSVSGRDTVTLCHKTAAGNKTYTMRAGDSLGIISDDLAGLSISGIGTGFITLSNGQEKRTREEFEATIFSASYQEQMLRLALRRHFETERQNFCRPIRIKTLALFFIDSIESYRGDKSGRGAWLKDTFDRLLREALEKELEKDNPEAYAAYLRASLDNVADCSAAYFAQDNNDSDDGVAKEVDLILHNKKALLAFENPDGTPNTCRFLFSKWTLKEGWDNPNIFTIAKLRSSGSENSKLQEVGRGLRLPVDEHGNRISNENFMLNYIVDFTEADFADKLVSQINEEIPNAASTALASGDIERVASLRGIDPFKLLLELRDKGFITDIKGTLRQERLTELFDQYPEFSTGVDRSKMLDRNKGTRNTVKVRKARFEELRGLWSTLNRKYILFFERDVNRLIEESLPAILENGVFGFQTMRSERAVVDASGDRAAVVSDAGVEYLVTGSKIPYRSFLQRAGKATSLPIATIHEAIRKYVLTHPFREAFVNETSLARLVNAFEEWKSDNLQGRFSYKRADYETASTALTNPDGTVRPEIVQGSIGIHMETGKVSDKYLYDAIAYDSELERKNIRSEIEEVIVYGKIPRRSISIPTIADSAYSPDFMYVVKKRNGEKEMNVIVETKGVENKAQLRGNELAKISCAKAFFSRLKADGYNITFRTQINSKSIKALLTELME